MQSIKKTKSFKIVYSSGRHIANHLFVMHIITNNTDTTRLGISVSKKVGNAVIRNRIRRLVKESFRLNAPMVKRGHDIVIVARKTLGEMPKEVSFQKVDKALDALLNKASLLSRPAEAKP